MNTKYLSAFLLTFALMAPAARVTSAKPQERKEVRIYDRDHKDYHVWNDNEDRAYRRYLMEEHREYRAYPKLKRNEQTLYWNWRHEHSDDDRR